MKTKQRLIENTRKLKIPVKGFQTQFILSKYHIFIQNFQKTTTKNSKLYHTLTYKIPGKYRQLRVRYQLPTPTKKFGWAC